MQLLYCDGNGVVVCSHDDAQAAVPMTAYPSVVRIIPYDGVLARIGEPPPPGPGGSLMPDTRPCAQPVETMEILKAYAAQVRWEMATAGIMYNTIPVATDRESQVLIDTLVTYGNSIAKPGTALVSFIQDSVLYPVTYQDILNISSALNAHVQSCRDTEASVITDLSSGTPTITTYDQVDAAFAAVKSNTLLARGKE